MVVSFYSYKDAHEVLKLPGPYDAQIILSETEGIACLKITEQKGSYHRIINGGRKVYYVGMGKITSPGHPAAYHVEKDQAPFWYNYKTETLIPILTKSRDRRISLLGYYCVDDICKRLSNEGFTYFDIELRRVTTRLPSWVTECPATRATATYHALRGYRCSIIDNIFDKSPSKRVPSREVQ
jgi:hypothetical protein